MSAIADPARGFAVQTSGIPFVLVRGVKGVQRPATAMFVGPRGGTPTGSRRSNRISSSARDRPAPPVACPFLSLEHVPPMIRAIQDPQRGRDPAIRTSNPAPCPQTFHVRAHELPAPTSASQVTGSGIEACSILSGAQDAVAARALVR